jgi:hypothetical protein
MRITLSLDLDTSSNSGLGTWFEDFENPSGLGKFAPQSLDAGKNSLARSDGMRCQYNNPGGVNSNSAGNSECFLGFTSDPPLGVNDWHLHDSSASNGGVGRAYSGSKSMHWGVHLGTTPKRDTTRFKQLDAAKSGIINVPAASAHPELSFAQQVSFVDNRGLPNGDAGESADRGVVEVNVLQASGADGPLWRKIYPYVNEYDEQGTDNFYNCTFDPTDDGNNEDDFFDPSDPNRRLGPSSTCKPEYTFACQGDTDYHLNDVPPKLCNAEGPGYKSADAVGSWVVPVFNLQDFAGRRIKIRFLATSIELGVSQTWDSYFGRDDIVADDGWYIDAVKISPVANLAMTVTPDTKSITTLPCAACTSIQAAMTATPGATPEPGVPVALDASASAVDFCKIEPPQYTFWIDENDNGVAGDAGDTLLRTAADDPHLLLAPVATGKIAVVVSCRTEPLCDAADGSNTAEAMVTVNCPAGIDRTAFGQTIALDKPYPGSNDVILSWAVATRVDIVKGNLSGTSLPLTLRGTGSFTGTLLCMTGDSEPIATFDDFLYGEPYPPSPGDGYYYLVRGRVPACGQKLTGYSTNTASESSGRDAEIAADPDTCP